jgi:hypothetical protein
MMVGEECRLAWYGTRFLRSLHKRLVAVMFMIVPRASTWKQIYIFSHRFRSDLKIRQAVSRTAWIGIVVVIIIIIAVGGYAAISLTASKTTSTTTTSSSATSSISSTTTSMSTTSQSSSSSSSSPSISSLTWETTQSLQLVDRAREFQCLSR